MLILGSRLRRLTAGPAIAGLLLMGCSGGDDTTATPQYHATIRRTSYGVPHIVANDFGSLGFGVGYAGAADYVCTLADQIVKVRSERAKTFGPGDNDANVDSDFNYLALGVHDTAEKIAAGMSVNLHEMLDGFVAGYNRYIADTGAAHLPAPCTNAQWVKPITTLDLLSYYADLALRGSAIPFLQYLKAAPPSQAKSASGAGISFPNFGPERYSGLGSNGWALGHDRADLSAHAMLVANPHFPWEGELRFHEQHLTIPGTMDVYGASLIGVPVINIGFNHDVAWTHTVTPAAHFTVYRLKLATGDPTSYVFDGAVRHMTTQDYTVDILKSDGTTEQQKRTFWRSHYGLMVSGPGIAWTATEAYTFRDANATDLKLGDTWLAMDLAHSVDEVREVSSKLHGIPWVFTIASDITGKAMLLDASRVPNLSPTATSNYIKSLATDSIVQAAAAQSVIILDGSTSVNDWQTEEPDGVVPVANAPQLVRSDFVFNGNDPPWLTNPAAPLVSYPYLYGAPMQAPIPRTHMNLKLLTDTSSTGPAGSDGRFTLDELKSAILSDRGWSAEQLLSAVAARCMGVTTVTIPTGSVDISKACSVLAAWNGRDDLDQKGPVIWREFLGTFQWGDFAGTTNNLYAVPFNPDQPLTTPSGLKPAPSSGSDSILVALGTAVSALQKANVAVDAPLGTVQYTMKGSTKIPIPGGLGREGVTNIVAWDGGSNTTLLPTMPHATVIDQATNLTTSGYLINFGSSYMMVVALTDAGPHAFAVVSYSESSDPASPHYADQTMMFSSKSWRPILFEETEIEHDTAFQSVTLDQDR